MPKPITVGFPRPHLEAGEKRDFLPSLIEAIAKDGAEVFLEHGYGSGMDLDQADYASLGRAIQFVDNAETYRQDIVVVLRYPGEEPLQAMQPGACLVSMLHYPTRPKRVAYLRSLGVEAVSLDSLADDVGRRLVENLRAVGWNGMDVAFRVLREVYPPPGLENPNRLPIKVTVMGAGTVGMFAIQAAIRYGNQHTWQYMAQAGATGVQATTVDYDLTNHGHIMQQILRYTDVLVDATQRSDPSQPIIPNEWIGAMREHAVLVDLSVDPYDANTKPPTVKGIEGIPHGNLDQYIFRPDDPAFDQLPSFVRAEHRRHAVSCYSWPGIYPRECMEIYSRQLQPILQTLVQLKRTDGRASPEPFFVRAIDRARLSNWAPGHTAE